MPGFDRPRSASEHHAAGQRAAGDSLMRRIMSGVPATLTVWVSSAEAYAEVMFDDTNPR